jgi:hypothetical protein
MLEIKAGLPSKHAPDLNALLERANETPPSHLFPFGF